MMKKSFFLLILISLLLYSCKIDGAYDVAKSEAQKIREKNSTLSQNSTLYDMAQALQAVVETRESINQLQGELESIDDQIDTIQADLNTINTSSNSDMQAYVSDLNVLLNSSKQFTSSLYDSTYVWDSMLKESVDNDNLSSIDVNRFQQSVLSHFKHLIKGVN